MSQPELHQLYNETSQLLQEGLKTTQQTTEFSLHLAQQQFEQLQAFKEQLQQQRHQQRELEVDTQRTHKMVVGLFVIALAILMIGLSAFGWLTYQIHQQHEQYRVLTSDLNQRLADVQQALSTQSSQPTQITPSNLVNPAAADLSTLSLDRIDELTTQMVENRTQLANSLQDILAQLTQQDTQQQKLKDDLNQIKKLLERPIPATTVSKPMDIDLAPILRQQQAHQERLQRLHDAVAQINKQLVDLNQQTHQQQRQHAIVLQKIEKKLDELAQSLTETPSKGDYIYRNPQQFTP
jgi:hypothetical protein